MTTTTTTTTAPEGARPVDWDEFRAALTAQVHPMTVASVSGFRVEPIAMDGEYYGIEFPCTRTRTVRVFLDFMDTYTVQRTLNGRVLGEERDIYCDEIDDAVYRAGMFVNVSFGDDRR